MSAIDYTIVVGYLVGVFAVGLLCARANRSLRDFFLGDRNIPWWAASCSGVAAIVSGVAFLGAPGLAFSRDYSYHQMRLGIPVALLVICGVMLPIFFRLNIYSIYEYLERRFDRRVRLLASSLFLLSKCGYLAIVIYAPSIVIAQATGLPLLPVILATGLGTATYTLCGGMKAVIWTDTLQVGILLLGIGATLWIVIGKVPGGLEEVIRSADAAGRLKLVNWSPSLTETYTVWSGLIGGAFLLVSQFGSNQAEIQRFLTTKSIRQANWALSSSMLLSIAVGISLFFIGTTLFGFYSAFPEKGGMAVSPNRVFAKFIVEELPLGLRGLLVAALLAASMSTISAILNSLATVASVDFAPLWRKRESTVREARWMTFGLGLGVTVLACFGGRFGNILEASAQIIGLFVGSMTGVFLLGMLSRRATAAAAFWSMVLGTAVAFAINFGTTISFLWLSPASAITTMAAGWLSSVRTREKQVEVARELHFGGGNIRQTANVERKACG